MNRTFVTATMALAGCLLFNTSCASLIIRSDDSAGVKAGKATSRLVLAVATLFISEISMTEAMRKDTIERAKAARKEAHELRLNKLYAGLDESRGTMTLDDAISKWGPPTSSFDGIEILVIEWNDESGGPRGWEMQLTFDKATGLLSD